MGLKLHPFLPSVWRSGKELQIGLWPPRAIISDISAADEALIIALKSGGPSEVMRSLYLTLGGTDSRFDDLCQQLAPALLGFERDDDSSDLSSADAGSKRVRRDGEPLAPRIVISSEDVDFARHLYSVLKYLGFAFGQSPEQADLVIVARNWAIPPKSYLPLNNHDLPHLPICFLENGARVGSIIVPGVTPCLRCFDLNLCDIDSIWPTVASQLIRRPNPGLTPLISQKTAAASADLITSYFSNEPNINKNGALPMFINLPQWLDASAFSWNSRCGCRDLPGSENEDDLAPLDANLG